MRHSQLRMSTADINYVTNLENRSTSCYSARDPALLPCRSIILPPLPHSHNHTTFPELTHADTQRMRGETDTLMQPWHAKKVTSHLAHARPGGNVEWLEQPQQQQQQQQQQQVIN